MCQIAQGLKIFQNCTMSQKCIVYNKRVEFIVYNKRVEFFVYNKRVEFLYSIQNIKHLMAATNSHFFEWGIDRAVVHAGICLGPKSINSWYKQRHSVCVNVGGGSY